MPQEQQGNIEAVVMMAMMTMISMMWMMMMT